jgi:hypothetical protein
MDYIKAFVLGFGLTFIFFAVLVAGSIVALAAASFVGVMPVVIALACVAGGLLAVLVEKG